MEKFKYNDVVNYKTDNLVGVGKIRGIHTSSPIFGYLYIIEDLSNNIPNIVYPFDCFCLSEVFLKKADL